MTYGYEIWEPGHKELVQRNSSTERSQINI